MSLKSNSVFFVLCKLQSVLQDTLSQYIIHLQTMKKPAMLLLLLALCGAALCLVFLSAGSISAGSITAVDDDHDGLSHYSEIEIVPVKRALQHGGYVVNIAMAGQQGSNVKILLAQQCFFGAVGNISLVEPFFYNNQFYGEPQSKPLDTQLRFRDFFNLRKHNEMAKQQKFAQLVSWEDFLSNAPREVIYIDLPESKRPECDIDRSMYLIQKSHCSDEVVQKMQFLHQHNFTVVKTIYTYKSLENLKKQNTSWPLHRVTLVFKEAWPHFFGVYSDTYGNPCVEVFYSNPLIQLIPSQQLLLQVDLYESHFLGGENTLTTVIRLEHIVEDIGRREKDVQQRYDAIETCLNVTANMSVFLSSNSRPFVTTDYSNYTSSSWTFTKSLYQFTDEHMNHILGLGRRVLEAVFQGWWEFEKWDSSFAEVTGGIDDPGYVAALQRTIAGRAQCLILVGGGDYQYLILQQYMHNLPHGSQLCVHLVCIPRFLHIRLQRLLQAFKLRCVWKSSVCTLRKY